MEIRANAKINKEISLHTSIQMWVNFQLPPTGKHQPHTPICLK